MKALRILETCGNTEYSYRGGEIVEDCDPRRAESLVKAGLAEWVDAKPKSGKALRILETCGNTEYSYRGGEIVEDCPKPRAESLVKSGLAEWVDIGDAKDKIQKAVKGNVEKR